jgi:predicted phage tail protein
MQFRQETLMNPPFAKDPPVKLNVPAKTLGLIYAILGAISALIGIFAITAFLGLSAVATAAGVVSGLYWLGVIGAIVGLIGTIVAAWGGYRMYQEKPEGKRLVVYGLAVNVVGNLIGSLGGASDFIGWIIGTAIAFVLYYLVIISRFPTEPPLVPTGTSKGPSTM